MKRMMPKIAVTAVLAVSIGGCAAPYPAPEKPFGSYVNQMVSAQRYDPPNVQHRPEGPPMDGDKASVVMHEYRKDVANPKDVGQKLVIKVEQ